MRRKLTLILALIPIFMIPITGLTWVIFSIFLFLIFFKDRLGWYERIKFSPPLKFFIFFMLFGLITEMFAVVDNLPKPPSERILLHHDPWIDMYLAIGYYAGFAISWTFFITRFNFSYPHVFLIGGFFGLIFEQTGGILFSLNLFIYLYVFLVYGSFQASAAVLAESELRRMKRKEIKKWTMALLGALIEIISFFLAWLFLFLLKIPVNYQ